MSDSDDGEELIIGEEGSSADLIPINDAPYVPSVLDSNCCTAQGVFPNFTIEQRGYAGLFISVPSSILPLSLAVVNQFDRSPTPCTISLTLQNNSFRDIATVADISNPFLGPSFAGRAVLVDRISHFFTPKFMFSNLQAQPTLNYLPASLQRASSLISPGAR
jgi:hypothetical protein